jgi:hypothetical protein
VELFAAAQELSSVPRRTVEPHPQVQGFRAPLMSILLTALPWPAERLLPMPMLSRGTAKIFST